MLIHVVRDGGDLRVGVLPQLQDGHLTLGGVGGQQLLPQPCPLLHAEGVFQGVQIEGHRKEKAPVRLLAGRDHVRIVPGNVGDYPVLIAPPLRKPGQKIEDLFIVGVKDVGAVFVDEHPVVVQTVVGVAADVVPALQHQHAFSLFRQSPGGHRAGVARARHPDIVMLLQNSDIPSCGKCSVLSV